MGLVAARWPAATATEPVLPGRPARHGAATPTAAVRAVTPALLVAVLGAVSVPTVDRPALAVALLLLQCLPVVARDRFPVPALLLTTTGAVTQVLVGLPPTNAFLGQAVVLAALVRRTARPWSAAPALVVLAANLLPVWAVGTDQLGRLAMIQTTTFAVAWAIGDAAARRAVVARAAARELAEQRRTAELRTRLGALAERLHIAQELHAVAGAGLRTIQDRAAAARGSGAVVFPGGVAEPGAAETIEAIGRQVLAELDRLLGLLRRAPVEADVGATQHGAEPAHDARAVETTPRGWSSRAATGLPGGAGFTLVAPAAVVGVLTVLDGMSPGAGPWPATPWLLLYAAAAALPLLARRRHPVLVTVAVTTASSVPLALGVPVADGPLGIAVAAHAVASYRSRRAAVALGAGAVSVVAALAAGMSVPYAVQLASLLPIFTAIAVYVGDTDRLARAHVAAVAQRLQEAREQDRLRERAAVAEQRAQAARDLHDSLGQTLSLIVLQAGAARLARARPDRAAESFAAIEAAAARALVELDAMLTLEPPPTPAVGDLDRLVDDARRAGTPVSLSVGDLGQAPASLHATVYRLVQEALTNVLKHAPGAAADVVVDRHGGTIRVRVTNTAGGPVPAALPSGSRGLAGMRERVALLGGSLACGPQPEGGFVVDATLPVPAPSVPAPSGAS